MLYMAVTVDYESQSFVTPIKHNASANSPKAEKNMFDQVLLVSDQLQCQKHTTNNMTHQKIPPSIKDHLCLQTDGITFWSAKCDK